MTYPEKVTRKFRFCKIVSDAPRLQTARLCNAIARAGTGWSISLAGVDTCAMSLAILKTNSDICTENRESDRFHLGLRIVSQHCACAIFTQKTGPAMVGVGATAMRGVPSDCSSPYHSFY